MNVYDFDGTIYKGDSSLDFYLFVLIRKPYIVFLLPYQCFMGLFSVFQTSSKEKMKEAFFLFIKIIPTNLLINEFWKKNNIKIQRWYLSQKNSSDIIISASPEFLLAPLVCDVLNVRLIASKISTVTGKYKGINCYGEEKIKRFREMYGEEKIDTFFSDSVSDDPLAKEAQQSFLVKKTGCIPWQNYNPSPIEKIKKTYLTKDFILFIFCGGMGTLVNFIFSLLISTKINSSISYVCGYIISLFVAYSLNAKLIFNHTMSFDTFIKFIGSYIPNFLILFTFVLIFLNIFKWNKVIVYGSAGLFGLPITFILVKLMVFRKNNKDCSKGD